MGVSLIWCSHDLFYDNDYNNKKKIVEDKVVIYVGDLDVNDKDDVKYKVVPCFRKFVYFTLPFNLVNTD